MLIKFTAKTMRKYSGHDGSGNALHMEAGQTAEVSEVVAKLLMQKYGANFEVVIQEKPAHAPSTDKALRKTAKTKTK